MPPAAAGASSCCRCQPNPIVTEQRTEDSCLFPAALLCHPRAAGDVTAGSWWHLAAPDGSVRASPSRVTETLREGRKTHPATRRQALCLISSHLISSFAMFRGRFNLLGSGRRLRPQRWQCPNAQGCPRRSRLSSRRSRGPQRGGTGTRAAPGALAADPAGLRGRRSETRCSSCPRPLGSG